MPSSVCSHSFRKVVFSKYPLCSAYCDSFMCKWGEEKYQQNVKHMPRVTILLVGNANLLTWRLYCGSIKEGMSKEEVRELDPTIVQPSHTHIHPMPRQVLTLQMRSAVSQSQFHLKFCCTGTMDVPCSFGVMMASSPITQGGGYLALMVDRLIGFA